MNYKASIYTLALLGALALAALSGGLLTTSDNAVHAQEAPENRPPEFDDGVTVGRNVDENTPPGFNLDDPITATDPDEDGDDDDREFGDTLTYSLEGEDADSFNLDPLTGQLSTKAPLDYEDDPEYSVTVSVRDSRGGSNTIAVTITVTNVTDEPPAAPARPTVTSGQDNTGTENTDESTTTLKVVWHPPENTGDRNITSHQYRYKRPTDPKWSDPTKVTGATSATISDLTPNTPYLVSVSATSSEGTSPWSLSGTGSTNRTNNRAPTFGQTALLTPTVPENSPPGQNVGVAVRAHDDDTSRLSYRLEGPDADSFDFITSMGQIRTKRGVTYNHEDPGCGYVDTAFSTACTHYVTVAAFDGAGGSDAIRVEIKVTDQPETPSTPARPTVRATERSNTSLDVSWSEPANAGPPITGYSVQYRRKGSSDEYSTSGVPDMITGTSTRIMGTNPDDNITPWLTRGTAYEVRVLATSGEGNSAWSTSGTGSTSVGNLEPVFIERPNSGEGSKRGTTHNLMRTISENIPPGRPVGRAVAANDGNGDRRTYSLRASADTDEARIQAALFDIDESSGQIRTRAGATYDYEGLINDSDCGMFTEQQIRSDSCYTVTVAVRDGLDMNTEREETETVDDTITVRIGVRDVDEPPSPPTVTVTSPTDVTTLVVTWDVPANTGPPISGYDVEYRQGSGAWSDDNCRNTSVADNCGDINDTTTTITELTANTPYSVRVLAENEEGPSGLTSVTGRTNRNKRTGPDVPNNAPAFNTYDAPTVDENTPSGQNVGSPVTATDGEGGTLAYSLDGPDKSSFTIDRNTGQIRTRSSLNFEGRPSYTVRVKVEDGQGGSASIPVTINIGDLDEPPPAPTGLKVTVTKDTGRSLEVTWNEPRNTGPPITDYDIGYRKYPQTGSPPEFQSWPHGATEDSTERTARITGLEPRTRYEVRVRAKNGEADDTENWSPEVRSTTNASNRRPTFEGRADVATRGVNENTGAGQNVGSPVSARDDDGNSLTYSLSGPDAASFDINRSSGLIRTRSGVTYDYESKSSYSVTVKVDDGQKRGNSAAAKSVTIEVENEPEAPSVPAAPRVSGVPGSTDSVRVTWDEPANTGPPITFYGVQYGVARTDGFTTLGLNIVDRSTIITGLQAGTRYEVQVRAENEEGTSEYSRSGTGSPNPDIANRNPAFPRAARTFRVAENTAAGDPIGDPVAASDPDDDPLTYELEGTDADSFDIDRGSGQIRTSAALNYEDKSRHSVTVRARDGRGGTATAGVTINVTDVGEPPSAPSSPTVIGASSTSLQVSWEAPENTGPPITDYDYRYQGPTDSIWTEVTNTTITGTTVTIPRLAASTSYEVEVRAKNAEGASEWSSTGIGLTNAPGANNPPVFPEGTSATRSVSASASAGTSIGQPVTATDADSGDTLTYSLEGRDAAFFDIGETNGQLLTKSGVTLLAGETYTVTVAADDGTDSARITVTIEATVAPPNNAPVFSDGASATRSVPAGAPAGTSIGTPVAATDADSGDTLNYSLEGQDAASFDINTSNGQLLTLAGVTLDRSTYTVTVVANDGTASARITVTITVVLNNPPTFTGTGTSRSVVESQPAGTNVGSPVTATDTDQGDTLTYTLGGVDDASFDIVATTGQIQTKAPLDEETKASYRVTVTANDGTADSAPFTVTITVTDVTFGCSTGGAVADAANNPGLVSDCEALLEARDKLEGRARLNWSVVTPITDWDGIRWRKGALEGTPKRVTQLWLHGRGLDGMIPAELGNLSSLEWLYLHRNDLSGMVPGALGSLTSLKRLYLYDNDLTGLEAGLGGMTSLDRLFVQRNALTGAIPSDLGSLTNLRWLSLYDNDLTGAIPSELGSMTSLERLYLHENDLSGAIPSTFSNLTNLTHLVLHRNNLSGTIPTGLGSLSNLKWLGLYDNDFNSRIPAQLGILSNLQRLYLHGNSLTGTIPSELGNLTALTNLWLKNNMLSGQLPLSLNNLTNLERVRISGEDNNFTDCIPAGLMDGPGRTSDAEELNLPTCTNP